MTFVGALTAPAAANETILLHSGHENGVPGWDCSPADGTTNVHRTDASPLLAGSFGGTQYDWANGSATPPAIGYGAQESRVFDPWFPRTVISNTRWISWRGSNPSNVTSLHAHEFEVTTATIASASLSLEWAANPRLGDFPGGSNLDGVYLNGVSLGASFRGGQATTTTTVAANISSLLVPGTNRLYFYVPRHQTSGQPGVNYLARIEVLGPNSVDVFEENDTCATAAPLGFGDYDDLTVSTDDEDWYSVSVAPGATFDARAMFDNAVGDVDLTLFAGDCASILDFSWSFDDLESVTWTNTGATAEKLHLLVAISPIKPSGTCNTYDLTIGTNTCPGTEDSFEPNDSLPGAFGLGSGVYPDLYVSDTSLDYYSFQVGPGDTLDIRVLFANTFGDIEIFLQLENGTYADDSFTSDDIELVSWTNPSTTDVETLVLLVFMSATSPLPCNTYQIEVEGALEPPLSNVNSAGVFKLEGLSDGSSWCVEITHDGSTETSVVTGLASGSTSAEIGDAIEAAVAAMTLPVKVIFPNSADHSCFKVVEFPPLPPIQPVTIRFGDDACADLCEPTTNFLCSFNPEVSQLIPFGGPYCDAAPNSTGQPSIIEAYGSNAIADNNLLLDATGLPPHTVGYFVAGNQQAFVMNPAGSQGNLCLSGTTLRLLGATLATGDIGNLALQIDVANVGGTGIAFAPGETWNFQCWHRDLNPTVTSNFSKATFIDFE